MVVGLHEVAKLPGVFEGDLPGGAERLDPDQVAMARGYRCEGSAPGPVTLCANVPMLEQGLVVAQH